MILNVNKNSIFCCTLNYKCDPFDTVFRADACDFGWKFIVDGENVWG